MEPKNSEQHSVSIRLQNLWIQGNNRIRNKGLFLITEGLSENKQSKMSTFGLRFNFLSEDAILNLIKRTTLKETFIMNNSITDYGLYCLKEGYDELNSKCQNRFVLQESRLERTVWIQPAIQIPKILYYFNEHQVGVILDVRNRKGQKYFADPKSLNKSLALSSTNQAYISNKKFQIYKAGTGNFIQKRKKRQGKRNLKAFKKIKYQEQTYEPNGFVRI
ncbi:unnamed protein product [Paramecium octaurelia]|uniref:Uncharacterized protein n=1 Tax=Paramecium octaurelia TaxID=43137 RepID=A0A8S1VG60_PAROT|nr:unnamed protein product [Paramecium octaurelia]